MMTINKYYLQKIIKKLKKIILIKLTNMNILTIQTQQIMIKITFLFPIKDIKKKKFMKMKIINQSQTLVINRRFYIQAI